MANNLIKNLFFQIHRRSVTLSSNSTLPMNGTSPSSSFTVQYLVNSCGLPLESALSVSQKFQLKEKYSQRAQSVLDLLKSHHFSDTQLANLIVKQPRILRYNAEDVLPPKIEYLVKNGFVGELLPQLILSNPVILTSSLDSKIKPSFECLKSLLLNEAKMVFAIKRDPRLLNSDLKAVLQPNIDFLMKEGVPPKMLGYLLTSHPRALLKKLDRIVDGVNAIKNLGFEPTAPMFVRALRIVLQMSESAWKEKIEVMKSMGWDEDEILLAFKRDPAILACSENKIKKALNFYTNTMQLDPHFVISVPRLLMYSIEKRIIPRYNVLKVLESKKLIKGINNKAAWSLTISEKNFMENYVLKYMDEVPGLLEIYPGAEKFLKKFIEKFNGDASTVLKMYPSANNFLNKHFEN